VVVHFMLDKRKPLVSLQCIGSAINDFSCLFGLFSYNIRMQQDTLSRKLQSATVYVETLMEVYQSREAALEIVQALQEVIDLLQEIRREVLRQELTSIMHNEDLPETVRKERVGKIFKSLA
jgi:Sec7-like guanine-nucleotide exchange factor